MSVSERAAILESLQAAVRAINGVAPYTYAVKTGSVSLDPTDDVWTVPSTEAPYVVIEPLPEGSRDYQPANQVKDTFLVAITARIDVTGVAPNRRMVAWEAWSADVERAVTVDITRGGHAVDTRLREPQPLLGVGTNQVYVRQVAEMRLYRTYGQP